MKNIKLLIIFAACFFITSCSSKKNIASEKQIIAVTIVPEETFVKAVAGDLFDVVVLVPPGSSVESYEPTPMEMENFSKAKIYFAIGVETEEASILPRAKEIKDLKVVHLETESKKVYPEIEFSPGQRDAHIWLSPKRAVVMVETISKELSLLDPKNKSVYEKNSKDYIQKLNELDNELRESLKDVKNKSFIVFHPAFGYFADDYGLKMYALEEEGKESTPQRMREVIDTAKKENIKAIFYQSEISSKQAESFSEEIGGKAIMLEPLSSDYINNLKKMADLIKEVM